MCLPFDNKTPNTFQGKRSVFHLQLIAFIQLALLFARQVAHFELNELFEIIFVIILWSSWSSLGHCQCLIYIIFTLYQIFVRTIFFATRFQNEVPILGETGQQKILNSLYLVTIIFYLIAQYLVFLAYREFVALENDRDYIISDPERKPLQSAAKPSQPASQNNATFAGRGITIG